MGISIVELLANFVAIPTTAPIQTRQRDQDLGMRRVDWVDCAKGITITLVVYNHVCSGLWTAGLPFWPPPYGPLATMMGQVRAPLFFLLSGLFIERSARKPASVFVLSKLKTLIYPFVLWYLIQSIFLSIFSPFTNSRPSPIRLLAEMFYAPHGQFWFLLVLFAGDMIYLALNRIGVGRMGLLAIGVAFCFATMAIDIHTLPITVRPFRAFVYLAVGVIVAPHLFGWSRVAPLAILFAAFALTITALIGVAAIFPRDGWVEIPLEKTPWAYPVVASPLGMLLVVVVSIILVRMRVGRPLMFIGTMSLEILVAHILGTGGARIVLRTLLGVQAVNIHLVVGTAAGLALPLSLGWLARRYRFPFLFRLA